MNKIYLRIGILVIFFALSGCRFQGGASTPDDSISTAESPSFAETNSVENSEPVTIKVLYTSDEHGWMQGQTAGRGAAEMVGLWKQKYNYPEGGNFLVLSGGDNWTGPAISTWSQGESMLEVMSRMGYQASAVGNHEFDFGLEVLKKRTSAASFPYLAANILYKDSGETAQDLGLEPYTIIEIKGIKVGIIGLSNQATAWTANPAYVGVFSFLDYADTLKKAAFELREKDVQIVLAITHLCEDELIILAPTAQELGIPLMGGAHCHVGFSHKIGSVGLIDSASYLQSFAYADLLYTPQGKTVVLTDMGIVANEGGSPDPDLAAVIGKWAEKTESEGGVIIGYLKNEIPKQSVAMQNLITNAWLWAIPQADIALTNMGGMRDRLPSGNLTLAKITSMMPFDNSIVEVRLTGEQIEKVLGQKLLTLPAIGGLHLSLGKWILNSTGEPLDPKKTYVVLVNDFMYAGGDHYDSLALFDPDGYFTAIDWRQPVIDWIKAQDSSQNSPLEIKISP